MIQTIPLDLFISFVVGIVFALSASSMLEREDSMINTYFTRALVFQMVIFFPIGLFLAWRYTAWSWMYLVNPHTHGKIWTLLLIVAYIPAMIAGFHITYLCIRAGKKGQAYWYLAGACLAILLISVKMFGRLYHVSDIYVSPDKIASLPGWFSRGWFLVAMAIIIVAFFGGISYVLRLNAADRRRMAREAFSSPVSGSS